MTWAMTALVAYLTVMGLLLFILLFGEAQLFQHTPVQWAHSFVTRDAWALSMRVIRRVCGARCAGVVRTRLAPHPGSVLPQHDPLWWAAAAHDERVSRR